MGLALGLGAAALAESAQADAPVIFAQATVPPTGMEEPKKPMTPEEHMQARYPQPVRVGELIGMPVLDDRARTLGHVREVVRTSDGKIELIVSYGGFFGWGTRPVAVPIEFVGIQGREVASLDMRPAEYKSAPTWHDAKAEKLSNDAMIKIALSRR